ncbi:FlgD immunoglobulin-like domain containing protein, partial [Hymenobacter agri]
AYAGLDSAAYFDAAAQVLRVRFRWRHQAATVRVFGAMLATNKPAAAPPAISLNVPYPNPFSSVTTISYDVAWPGNYELHVLSLTGQLVANLPVTAAAPGAGAVQWDGTDRAGQPLPAGVYLLELNGQHQRVVRQ